MNIPLNGRIAIIDDEISQAEPLLKALSKNQIPYAFYKGNDISYLPDADSRFNDIRVLFLDINLVDEKATLDEKLVKSTLINVLRRVISPQNFPYALIFWSRHQKEHESLVRGLFENELKDRQPISIRGFVKSDFFPNFSSEEAETDIDIIEELNKIINSELAYSYLLNWENQVHTASDRTLQEIFSSYHTYENWTDNANHLINKLGISYSGKAYFKQDSAEKIKSAYNSLTYLANDTLEKSVNSKDIENPEELTVEDSDNPKFESFHSINKKLLFSDDNEPIEYPGSVIEDQNTKTEAIFQELLNNSFSRSKIETELTEEEIKDKTESAINKLINKKSSSKRKEIRSTWKRIYLTATPLCDYVQNKYEYNRCVKGMIISSEHLEYIDTKSEAIFISPKFLFKEVSCVMILHFRYFFTSNKGGNLKNLNPLFRARQQLLAEIQSKLSRHISRQGILFLDDR
ncbi:hypothetical protein [Allomuricauda sp. F6463D]|uniref:hypothetical protein n=1 Tax=Allomuricauda sp. F6463D TaxID=2926409 RepID=UPI001FF1FBFE|nr:hypothetical protein [Muricauda sp. F6463D]MCK0161674.1 hypothetical protein [Muricauda sp. F6463D]